MNSFCLSASPLSAAPLYIGKSRASECGTSDGIESLFRMAPRTRSSTPLSWSTNSSIVFEFNRQPFHSQS